MKKRIFWFFSLLTAVFTIAAAAVVSLLYYRFYQENVRHETRSTCALIAEALERLPAEGRRELLGQMKPSLTEGGRLTLVDSAGTVLFDTDREAAALDNHAGRSELAAAAREGFGESIRRSDTFGVDQYYCAVRLGDGALLRASRRMDRIIGLFEDTLPLVLLLILALVAVSPAAASLLTRTVLRPVNAAANTLDQLLLPRTDTSAFPELSTYEELAPFLLKIRALHEELDSYLRTLRRERDTIGTITQNMREGLVLLDGEQRILTINAAAVLLLDAPESAMTDLKELEGQNLLHLSRSARLRETVEEVLSTGVPACFTECDGQGRWRRFLLSPAGGGCETGGTLALIVDVTTQMRAEQMRRDFAANVSHELKTPLTSINGFAEMMENGMIQESDIRPCAGRIHREASRLIALINDIIRLSQIENASEIPDHEVCFLHDLAREALLAVDSAAKRREVRLTSDIEQIILTGSRSMLYELLYNLLDNAVGYNQEQGEVSLTVRREGDTAVILVSDTGIGIPKEEQERIFERFYRVDKSRSKQTGGTGLGLSIVKHIVEQFQGRITVDSELGRGATMRVELPIR